MKEEKVYIAGHWGMVGAAALKLLKSKGYSNIVTRFSSELDLRNQQAVKEFMSEERQTLLFWLLPGLGEF